MYKPLSLVLDNSNREFERRSYCTIYSFFPKNGSYEQSPKDRDAQLRQDKHKEAPASYAESKDVQDFYDLAEAAARPRCIKSYRSDRMAIYDEQRDTFHAYSVIEAISQPGLSFQEAVDWVDDRLVLVGNGMRPKNFAVAVSLILGSWAVAIMLISMAVRFFF